MSHRNRQTEPPRAPGPPRYKLALLSWVGAYAVITTILALLGPAMARWPLMLRTLLLSVLMVLAMTWVVVPSLTRLLRDWLSPAARHPTRARSPHRRRRSTTRLQPDGA
jgi:antibiotic biosynthesis monooxygenase (ABM) superfamily enzyme